MKKVLFTRNALAVISALLLLCSNVYADVSLTGDLEIDTSYLATSEEDSATTEIDDTEYDLGGRIKVVPAARTEAGNLFFEAKAEILVKTDNTDGDGVQVDDSWGKIGTSSFDVQIGRFEAWNLHDESNDMLIVEAPNGADRYKANYSRGRMDGAGQLAVHFIPSDAFGFEAGIIYGNEDADLGYDTDGDGETDDVGVNIIGFRPVIKTKFGPVELTAGADMLNTTPKEDGLDAETSKLGYGATVKTVFGPATLGINYASGTESGKDINGVDLNDTTTTSVGGYCDLALGKGVLTMAAFLTNWEEDNNPYENEHSQYYIAYAHPLPVDGASIKFAVSQASATEENSTGDEESDALGFKVRLYYAF